MPTIRETYQPIDLHGKHPLWPATTPPLTTEEAVAAARRLWRWAEGTTCPPITPTSGNRYTWTFDYGYKLRVNPDKGWQGLAHDLSHLFFKRANPHSKPHCKEHARFETRLVKEIVKRGWLEGSLQPKPKWATATKPALDPRQVKLDRIEARMLAWQRKQKRAANALAKLVRQQRYYTRALAAA